MKTESKLSTRKKSKTRPPKIKKKTINFKFLAVGVVVLIGATAPFWHVFFDQSSENEFLGFENTGVFLYAFGTHFAYFCASSFFFWIKSFIDTRHKDVIKIINFVGGVFVGISAYFLLWVFNPYSDFPKYVYHIAFAVSALCIAYGMYLLHKFITYVTLTNKHAIKNLLAFMVRVRTTHYKKVAKKAYYAERYNKAMDTKDTVDDNAQEFEEDFYGTLEKVDPLN